MKKYCVAAILALGLCSNVLALNYLGPPTTRMKAGQWFIGASYADSEQDIEFDTDIEFDDVDQNATVGRVGVGLATDRLEIFGLFGMTELERDLFETDDEFLVGGGFRVTMQLDKKNNLDIGVVGQVTYSKFEDESIIFLTPTDYELSLAEILFGAGPCWRPGPWLVYGGVLIQWIEGNLDTIAAGRSDVNQESLVGAYLGGGVDLAEHWMITAEGQATPDAYGVAAGVQLRF